MRLRAFAFGLVVAALLPFAGQAATYEMHETYATPQALLEALYAPYLADGDVSDYEPFFSGHLNDLYAIDAENSQGEVGAIGFDPVIAGQDFKITNFAIGATEIDGTAAKVTVTFDNFDSPQTLHYSLVDEDGAWKVDDIQSTTPEFEWQLSEIFANAEY